MQISFWSIDLTKSCRWSSAVGKPAKASAGVFISNNSFTVGWRKVFKVDNLELLEHIQHSDTIISWRGLSLYWDVFQMCLNNRGIKLPLKCGLEIKGSNLLSHRFLQTIISVLLDRVNLFFSLLSFFLFSSLYSFSSLFPSAHFWSWSFRFSHTLHCHTSRPQKCRTEKSVRGLRNSTCRG